MFKLYKRIVCGLKKGLSYTVVFSFLILCGPAVAVEIEKFEGDIDTGSRAEAVHLIPLLDEYGRKIFPDQHPVMPFSTRKSCGDCHDYATISKGWHFNSVDPNAKPGRVGHPWIFVDAETATQIPLSYRGWPGTYRPDELGLTAGVFIQLFGRQMPGGGAGEFETKEADEIVRRYVSGKLEVNCLACHSNHPGQDQAEYADQLNRLNFRWAATGACEFATVSGVAAKLPFGYDYLEPNMMPEAKQNAPSVVYNKNVFDDKNRVLFDIVKEVPNRRCYFCHSTKLLSDSALHSQQDVHLAAGLRCIDCHRNEIDHQITRGYESEFAQTANRLAITASCEGCHLGDETLPLPVEGRLGAPVPKHRGIPAVHFDKLTCTACHSGPWPDAKNLRVKTSIAHGLGTRDVDANDNALPHIISPVFAKDSEGKIGPHNLVWPAFWGILRDGKVSPAKYEIVRKAVITIISRKMTSEGNWAQLTGEQIKEALKSLSSAEALEGEVVYICGGEMHYLGDNGQLVSEEHNAAAPYLWPIAHDVRAAAQSLGVRRCQDCHATDAAFTFGEVAVDSPLVSDQNSVKVMTEFEDINHLYIKLFAFTFVFRPWLKAVALIASAILGAVLLLYALKALGRVTKFMVEKDSRKD